MRDCLFSFCLGFLSAGGLFIQGDFFAFYLVEFFGWLRFFSFSCFPHSAQKRIQEGRNR